MKANKRIRDLRRRSYFRLSAVSGGVRRGVTTHPQGPDHPKGPNGVEFYFREHLNR